MVYYKYKRKYHKGVNIMENKNKYVALKVVLGIVGALLAIAGACAVLYKVVKKRLKFTVEITPDEVTDGTVEANIIDTADEADGEIEIALVEETDEEE